MRDLRASAASAGDCETLHQALDQFGKLTENLANIAITEVLRNQEPTPRPLGTAAGGRN
jgi:hypothetical protein